MSFLLTTAHLGALSTKLNVSKLFEKACTDLLENDMDTVTEFHEMISTLGEEIYSVKMTQTKLKEKYKNFLKFVSREGKSNIVLLDRAAELLSEKWYTERQNRIDDKTARVVQRAAVLLKETMKNHEIDSATYPTCDDIRSPMNLH